MAGFPIFVEVGARAPLVVGGGELALAKVRLLLKRATSIDVVADRLVPALREMRAQGRIRQLTAPASEEHVRGRPLVISATGDDETDAQVFAIASELGVPINVPDRPELSTFSLPAIVDRGTVTLAVGTEGAAPVLATRLRHELELNLHPRLGRLAEIAREYRPRVAKTLRAGPERRSFWDDVLGGEAGAAILAGDETHGRRLIEARLFSSAEAPARIGRVLLVGAGPGDPELLTLKAVRALKSADVVLYDGLMGEGVLDYARREALLISVAKARGHHSRTQAEINALMVAFAREGKTVVRLKGGDPLVFGRGGEEIDTLRASGIAVEVIPGITAATAAAASLQIPLTHRDVARSVTFISGHAVGDGSPDFSELDFAALAHSRATLAVYMGLATAHVLARQLIAAGWAPATPVIALSRISQRAERRVATTIQALEAGQLLPVSGPTLLIIGEVASLDMSGAVDRLEQAAPHQLSEAAHA
jgi:uroporphyrin-III C-methyltransferase/precorrin-2 dehydrogenase/sirohydrochlorin ferrochelatase